MVPLSLHSTFDFDWPQILLQASLVFWTHRTLLPIASLFSHLTSMLLRWIRFLWNSISLCLLPMVCLSVLSLFFLNFDIIKQDTDSIGGNSETFAEQKKNVWIAFTFIVPFPLCKCFPPSKLISFFILLIFDYLGLPVIPLTNHIICTYVYLESMQLQLTLCYHIHPR